MYTCHLDQIKQRSMEIHFSFEELPCWFVYQKMASFVPNGLKFKIKSDPNIAIMYQVHTLEEKLSTLWLSLVKFLRKEMSKKRKLLDKVSFLKSIIASNSFEKLCSDFIEYNESLQEFVYFAAQKLTKVKRANWFAFRSVLCGKWNLN